MGRALGIDSYLPHELSLSLGGCEVSFYTLPLNTMMIKIKVDTCKQNHFPVITKTFPDCGMLL
jgi:hypothetical protein